MSFADLEQRTNATVMRRLSNARALQVGQVQDFPVIFDRAHAELAGGISTTLPIATALDSDLAGIASNSSQLVIKSITYTVRDLQPDGTGFTVVILEAA